MNGQTLKMLGYQLSWLCSIKKEKIHNTPTYWNLNNYNRGSGWMDSGWMDSGYGILSL